MAGTAQLVHSGTGKGGPFGIWQATIAGHVNVYLVKPERGPSALVDAGPAGAESMEEVRALLAAAKVKPEQVDRIVLTHAHPNHAGGLAGARELLPKAELCASAFDAQYLRQPARQTDDDLKRLKVLFRRWGAPSESKDLVAAALGSYRSRRVWPESPAAASTEITRELREGAEVELGGAAFRVIEAPGHHAGALLFYHPDGGELFTGDNVAMEPVPMPMLSTGRDGERIVSGPALVDGLERLKDLAPKTVFPGHGAVLTEPEHVLDEEIHFYRGRAQRLMAQLIDAKMSVWEIAAESDPEKLVGRISLVFCFLDLLLRESAIDCKLEKGVDRYHVPL